MDLKCLRRILRLVLQLCCCKCFFFLFAVQDETFLLMEVQSVVCPFYLRLRCVDSKAWFCWKSCKGIQPLTYSRPLHYGWHMLCWWFPSCLFGGWKFTLQSFLNFEVLSGLFWVCNLSLEKGVICKWSVSLFFLILSQTLPWEIQTKSIVVWILLTKMVWQKWSYPIIYLDHRFHSLSI